MISLSDIAIRESGTSKMTVNMVKVLIVTIRRGQRRRRRRRRKSGVRGYRPNCDVRTDSEFDKFLVARKRPVVGGYPAYASELLV
jgi:hypothetical protein